MILISDTVDLAVKYERGGEGIHSTGFSSSRLVDTCELSGAFIYLLNGDFT